VCAPTARGVVGLYVAIPEALSVPVPSVVDVFSSMNVTLPVGVLPVAFTVAVNVTLTPYPAEAFDDLTVVVVVSFVPELTVCGTAADVLPVKFESPDDAAVMLYVPAFANEVV